MIIDHRINILDQRFFLQGDDKHLNNDDDRFKLFQNQIKSH